MTITNIGHYRLTDYGRQNMFTLYNTRKNVTHDITQKQYESIRDHMSLAACEFVEGVREQMFENKAYNYG